MDPVYLDANLRPLRIGLLVDPENRVAVSRVVRLAACLWGGTACPLIPVMREVPETWHRDDGNYTASNISHAYLRFFEPDVLAETEPGQIAALIGDADEFSVSERRLWDLSSLFDTDSVDYGGVPIGVGMDEIYGDLFETVYQFKRHRKARVLRFDGGDAVGIAFFEAAYGMFPKGQTFAPYRKAYRQLEPQKVTPDVDQWNRIEWGGCLCPFHFTGHGISIAPYTLHHRGKPILVFDPCSATDVIDFWNFRVIYPNVRPVNVHWLAQCGVVFQGALEFDRKAAEHDRLIHLAASVEMERVLEAAKVSSSSEDSDSLRRKSPRKPLWAQLLSGMEGPEIPVLSAKGFQGQVVPTRESFREGRPVVDVPALSPDFPTQAKSGPVWVTVLRPTQYEPKDDLAGAVPTAALNERVGAESTLHGQFASREGHIALHSIGREQGLFSLPTMQEAIHGWLDGHGIRALASDAGRVADQLLAAVGGLPGVGALDKATVELLSEMARKPERTAPIGRIRRARLDDSALATLVSAGAVRLAAVADCTHCQTENWYGLDEVGTVVGCERCLKRFPFPQGIPKQEIWKYRVVGPFATPDYARGGYTVALALASLRAVGPYCTEMTYSTGLELDRGGELAEADFFAWLETREFARRAADPTTVLGECKSYASNAFSDEDIGRLKTLCEWFPGAYVVAACLKDSLSADEVHRLRDLAEWGWSRATVVGKPSRLVVLTGTELFAQNVQKGWQDAGGALADLAQRGLAAGLGRLPFGTQEAYLGFSEPEIAKMARGDAAEP